MFINIDPMGMKYESLLDLAFEVCEEFMFVMHIQPYTINENATKLVEDLSPYLKSCNKENNWIGTKFSNYAMVHYYYTTNEAKEIIKKVSMSLHTWRHPNLPEDLCFVKKGEPWLINTSHERCSYINTNSKEEIQKILNIGLNVRLDEEEKSILR